MGDWMWSESACWIQKSISDPAVDCNPRVLQSLLNLEDRYIPTSNYFQLVQRDGVQPWMRKTVTTWMLEVCEEQRTEIFVFCLACNLLDRFLSVCTIRRSELQLLGAASLLLASKLRETMPLTAQTMVMYTDNSITIDQLLDMELLLLLKLKWDPYAPTAKDFLPILLGNLVENELLPSEHLVMVKRHAQTYIDLIAIDDEFLMTPPSMIASCCIAAAIRGNKNLDQDETMADRLLNELHKTINSELEIVRSCFMSVCRSLQKTLLQNEEDKNRLSSSEDDDGTTHRTADSEKAQSVGGGEGETSLTPTDVGEVYF